MRNNEQLANTQDFETSAPLGAMESVIFRRHTNLRRDRPTNQQNRHMSVHKEVTFQKIFLLTRTQNFTSLLI